MSATGVMVRAGVNNCVGIGNHKLFLLFIGYTAVMCVMSLAMLVSRESLHSDAACLCATPSLQRL
jgi:DHHC palmitoyltransferase